MVFMQGADRPDSFLTEVQVFSAILFPPLGDDQGCHKAVSLSNEVGVPAGRKENCENKDDHEHKLLHLKNLSLCDPRATKL